jgi:LacI family transcriptional regulator
VIFMPQRAVSIIDVAKACNTAISTVSNVINGTRYVSPDLERKVRDAIRELGYVVNPVARSLKNKKSCAVGVIITNFDRIFFTPVIKGIQDVLSARNYRLTIASSNGSLEQEQSIFNMLCHNWIDGIIVDSAATCGQADWYQAMAKAAAGKRRIPVVGLESWLDAYGPDSVGIDNRKAAFSMAQFLKQKGCGKIVHVAGPTTSPLSQARLEGFIQASSGCSRRVEHGDFSPGSGFDAMNRVLAGGEKPDAVFAANDEMAVGAIHALETAGIAVPGEVKVAGFDDTFVASLVHPSLTTVHVPKYRLGLTAAEQVLRRMDGDLSESRHIEMPFELIERQSTGNSSPAPWNMANW